MLTPTTQDKPCVCDLNEASPVTSEQSAHFQGWNITELAPELLLQITRHLSLEDRWNLALASRRIRFVLEEFGELEVASYYYSLPRNRQLFYRDLSIANPQLIHHLQSSKIKAIARLSHCPENLPAICAYHAYHLHNETINAKGINFVVKNVIGRECEIGDYYINRNHSHLIIEDSYNSRFSIWTAAHDGFWCREFMTEPNLQFNCSDHIDRYQCNTIFVPVSANNPSSIQSSQNNDNAALLSIIERNESGLWSETQRITFKELFPRFCGKRKLRFGTIDMKTSPDGNTLIYSTKMARSVILGRELNGQWAVKGECPKGYSINFSPDSNHIAINRDRCVKFFGKQKDGSWSATETLSLMLDPMALIMAGIEEDDLHGFANLAFSPDSRHFVACFNDAKRNFKGELIKVEDFFVIVTSLDDNGQWSETARIIKHNPVPTDHASLVATFSPDGNYLVVHGAHSFDIWHLTNDNTWTPVVKDHGYLQKSMSESVVQFNADSSVFLLLRDETAMVWQLDGPGMWTKHHNFTYPHGGNYYSEDYSHSDPQLSADGQSIICTDGKGRLHIWVQDQCGQWVQQTLKTDLRIFEPAFNQEGDLLAGINVENESHLIVLGMTKNGTWQEKGRLHMNMRICNFNFSNCGRSLMVLLEGEVYRRFLIFYTIEREW